MQYFLRLDPSYIEVKMGLYDFNNPTERTKAFAVEKMWIHEDYDRITHKNDIALLRLSQKAYFTPICLPPAFERYQNDYIGTVVGWGQTEFKLISDVIQKTNLRV